MIWSRKRFVAVLIEHTAGKFPLWLTPDQVSVPADTAVELDARFGECCLRLSLYSAK